MLTTKQIEHAKPKAKIYRLFDGLGLYLEIDPKGGKYWRLKYRYLGKEKRLAIGKYPEMTLLEARERRDEARKLISNNIDPSAQKVERRHAALVKSAKIQKKYFFRLEKLGKIGSLWKSPRRQHHPHAEQMCRLRHEGIAPPAHVCPSSARRPCGVAKFSFVEDVFAPEGAWRNA